MYICLDIFAIVFLFVSFFVLYVKVEFSCNIFIISFVMIILLLVCVL